MCRKQFWAVVVDKRQLLRLHALERVEDLPAAKGSCFHFSSRGELSLISDLLDNFESIQGDNVFVPYVFCLPFISRIFKDVRCAGGLEIRCILKQVLNCGRKEALSHRLR